MAKTESIYKKSYIEKFKGNFTKVDGGCTVIPTKTLQLVKNPWNLSLYCYLASKPPEWHINPKEIKSHFDVGINKVWKGLNDLIMIGLIERIEVREKGKYVKFEYYLYLEPKPLEEM